MFIENTKTGGSDLCSRGTLDTAAFSELSRRPSLYTRHVVANWDGFFCLGVVEGIASHFWFLENQIMMLPWQLPSVTQTNKATTFAEASSGQGSISRGRDRNWDGKKLCELWTFTEANLWDTRMNIIIRRQTLEKPPNKPKFGFLLAGSPDHGDYGLGDAIPTLCHRLLADRTLGNPVICDKRAEFSSVHNKKKTSAEIRNIGM